MQDDQEERIRRLAYALWDQAGRPEGEASRFWFEAERQVHDEQELDEGLEESFPGSDAPASTMRHRKSEG